MNEKNLTVEPKLAKPGAGLPFVEWAVAKYILLPRLYKNTSKEQALENFGKESKKLIAMANSVDPKLLTERRLVPRLRGLEDSSRYWSVAMTLEHLVIVGNLMREAVVQLSSGGTTLSIVGTAEVKPHTSVDPQSAIKDFEEMSNRFLLETSAADTNAFPKATHPHPWFGPLTAHQWLLFAAPHENIHRQQMKAIIAQL